MVLGGGLMRICLTRTRLGSCLARAWSSPGALFSLVLFLRLFCMLGLVLSLWFGFLCFQVLLVLSRVSFHSISSSPIIANGSACIYILILNT